MYDRFHRHSIRLGLVTVPGGPVSYQYKDGESEGSIALHVDNASNEKFYSKEITPLSHYAFQK